MIAYVANSDLESIISVTSFLASFMIASGVTAPFSTPNIGISTAASANLIPGAPICLPRADRLNSESWAAVRRMKPEEHRGRELEI